MYSKNNIQEQVKFFLALLGLIGIVLAYPIAYKFSKETIKIKVKDKERSIDGTGDSIKGKYIVFAEGEVFENTDSYLFGKFGSSNIQNQLDLGQTYEIVVAGWRVPFLSWYRNIISIEAVGDKEYNYYYNFDR